MKSIKNVIFAGILAVFSTTWVSKLSAQERETISERLIIGDTIPDVLISNFYHSVDSVVSIKSLYQTGGLIISFWATWCSPCIDEMRFLTKVKPHYDDLRVLSVTYEDEKKISNLFNGLTGVNAEALNIVGKDTLLRKFFPHNSLPHVVWINKMGVVTAITGSFEVTEENIEKLLANQTFDFIEKREETFNFRDPMRIPDSLIQYRSLFHGYRKNIGTAGFSIGMPNSLKEPAMRRFYGWNVSATYLLWNAYNMGSIVNYYLIELITTDSTKYYSPNARDSLIFAHSKYAQGGGAVWPDNWKVNDHNWMVARQKWAMDHLYSYDFIVSNPLPDSVFFKKVISELEFNLNVSTSLQDRNKKCMVVTLKENSKERLNTLKTKKDRDFSSVRFKTVNDTTYLVAESATIDDILYKVQSFTFGRKIGRKEPYVNETNYTGQIDLKLSLGNIREWPTQEEIERVLNQKLGFNFNLGKRSYPVLVIKDKN